MLSVDEPEEQSGSNDLSLQLKMKLMEISMIDYEINNSRRCLHAIPK
jgi:hypothetical protein